MQQKRNKLEAVAGIGVLKFSILGGSVWTYHIQVKTVVVTYCSKHLSVRQMKEGGGGGGWGGGGKEEIGAP